MTDVPHIRERGTRLGNWLSKDRRGSCTLYLTALP